MSRIRLLSESTVNRIAAGEVIERPAAATKELVENALDAGATRISVSLDGGGIDRLEVTDNGVGMSAEELALCVLRHATSKLTDDNLVRITTLGFRGEALPSIGAAARLQITSRPPDTEHANVISVEGGRVTAVAPTAGVAGTRVVVRDLFFATPARRKFLKTPRIEAEHAEAVVRRLALSAPRVAFRLELDGRVAFEAPAQERSQRVAALLGGEAAAVMLPVQEERNGLRISGYICSPAVTRATPAAQALIVNNRPVADAVLRTAVKVAYRDVIAAGRHAIVALYLDVPPDELDVNVHPAKTELRYRDAGLVPVAGDWVGAAWLGGWDRTGGADDAVRVFAGAAAVLVRVPVAIGTAVLSERAAAVAEWRGGAARGPGRGAVAVPGGAGGSTDDGGGGIGGYPAWPWSRGRFSIRSAGGAGAGYLCDRGCRGWVVGADRSACRA